VAETQLVLQTPVTTQRDKEMDRLLEQAQRGDTRALTTLKERLADRPKVWEAFGDVARQARTAWVKLYASTNLVVAEGVERKIATLRAELLGDTPTPLERLLVEQIVVCWLQTAYIDHLAAGFQGKPGTFREGEYWQQAQERASRRYLAAIRALAQVRRLLAPAVQVNIAERQVNVAQVTGTV